MSRGYLSGFVVGAVLSAGAAAVIALVAGPPRPPEISADPPQAAEVPADVADMTGPVPGQGESDPPQPAIPTVDAPERDAERALSDVDTRPAGRPQTGTASSGVAEPAATGDAGGVAVEGVAPVNPDRLSTAPAAPGVERQEDIVTEPPQPAVPDVTGTGAEAGGGAGLQAPEMPRADDPVAQGGESAVTGPAGAPAPPRAPDQSQGPRILADPAPRPGDEEMAAAEAPGGLAAPGSADAPTQAEREEPVGARAVADPPAAPDADAPPAAAQAPATPNATGAPPGIAALPQAAAPGDGAEGPRAAPSIGTPASSLLDRDTGAEAGAAGSDPEGSAVVAEADGPALRRNAESFDNPNDQPLMAIILMDTGQSLEGGPVGLAALGSFPYPLSFAVDTSLPDAAERAARYRAEGLEVLALVDLPPSLTASDTEVALTTLLDRVPQAVAVLEGPGTGLQGSAEISAQVGAILQETGHGIVWQPNGLDTAQKLAARDGVASQTLFRDFDSADQTPTVIRRFLDQAAFKAGQQGSVIMVGRVRPDTISALLLWGLQDRAQRVAVAPVSAVLGEAQGGE